MSILDLLKRKKKEVAVPIREPTLLEKLCGDDKALYEDLSWFLVLDPGHYRSTYEDDMRKAGEAEKKGNVVKAAADYKMAGALALYEKNVAGFKKAFDKVAELSDRKFERVREVPEKAVAIAQGILQNNVET